MALHTLKIKNGSTVKDLIQDFGFVCLEGASYPSVDEFKPLSKTDWLDEDGTDTYHPSVRRMQSFDVEIPIGTEGSWKSTTESAKVRLEKLVNFLSGRSEALSANGLSIYMPRECIGYHGCDINSISDKEYYKLGDYEILTCKLVFNVSDPSNKYDGK